MRRLIQTALPIAPYTLYNNGSFVARVTKNQQINGGQFNSLGSYNLTAGTLEVVLDNNASGYVIADSVEVISYSGDTTSGGATAHMIRPAVARQAVIQQFQARPIRSRRAL